MVIISILIQGCSVSPNNVSHDSTSELSPDSAKAIAKQAYFWGMHQVAFYTFRYQLTQNEQSPIYSGLSNVLWNRKPITAAFRVATTPNASTMYGFGVYDLRQEPIVITVPAIKNRYWSVQACDQYAKWYAKIGSQWTGTDAQKLLIVGPDFSGDLPSGFVGSEIVRATSDFSLIAFRLALKDYSVTEIATNNQLMDAITSVPLSMWIDNGRRSIPPKQIPVIPAAYQTIPGMERTFNPNLIPVGEYYKFVNMVINDPAMTKRRDSNKEIIALQEFAKIGIKQGGMFDMRHLSKVNQQAVKSGFIEAQQEAAKAYEEMLIVRGGYSWQSSFNYDENNWVSRAANGIKGIGAPVLFESHGAAILTTDSQDRILDSNYSYTLTFDMDNLPPVTEFWSLPMYDQDAYFVDNEISRYTVNSFMLNNGDFYIEDNKLVFYLQNTRPLDPNKAKNWLPTPKQGGFRMTARFYGPNSSLIDGSYEMPRPVKH